MITPQLEQLVKPDATTDSLPLQWGRLISLWDMIQFFAAGLAHNYQWLLNEKNTAHLKAEGDEKSIPDYMDKNRLNALLRNGSEIVKGLISYCDLLEMSKTKERIESFLSTLNVTNKTPSCRVVHSELLGIEKALWKELVERKCVFVPLEKVQYFEQEKLFGEKVYDSFKEARQEIREAGNCLASGLNTAAVFHLMRVMEFGLRKLAAELKATALIKKLRQTKIPIEYGTWEEVIVTLESKVEKLKEMHRGPKREKKIDRCDELLKEFRSVKDLFRNKVMHARETYDFKRAQGAFEHTRLFIQKLVD